MKLLQVRGPFTWNEAFFDDKGNPGIRPRVAYLVRCAWDAEFRGRNRPGTVLLIGTCSEGGRSRLGVEVQHADPVVLGVGHKEVVAMAIQGRPDHAADTMVFEGQERRLTTEEEGYPCRAPSTERRAPSTEW